MNNDIDALQNKIRNLETELQELRHLAKVTGSGAVAQGTNAKSVGASGILIEGDVFIAENRPDNARAIDIYCRWLMENTSNLPLRSMDINASDPMNKQKPIKISNIFIDLDTTQPAINLRSEGIGRIKDANSEDRERMETISVLDAVLDNRTIVLLGDPGSGKTTFLNFLAHSLAANIIYPSANWLKNLPNWPKKEVNTIPIIIFLRDLARSSTGLPKSTDPAYLWRYIISRLDALNLSDAAKPLIEALESGTALILFDGLDEIPTQSERIFIRELILSFLKRYPKNRYIITCRVLSYHSPEVGKPDLRINDLPVFELAPFDEYKIERFIIAWYKELARLGAVPVEDSSTMAEYLRDAVQRRDLYRLARNPLLLTVMALVHTHKGHLPDVSALLYEETIDILLWRWEQVKLHGQDGGLPRLRQYLREAGRTDVDLKRVLWELAYNAHLVSMPMPEKETIIGISELQLEKKIASLNNGDRNWAIKIINVMKVRSGLLLEFSPEVYNFPHRSFQEYLAGAHLAAQKNFSTLTIGLIRNGGGWREIILYAVGRLVHVSGDIEKPLALVAELSLENCDDNSYFQWMSILLASDVLCEIGVNRVSDSILGRELIKNIQVKLEKLINNKIISAGDRVRAGNNLSTLGDIRFSSSAFCLPKDKTLGFEYVSAGPFLMGSSDDDLKASPAEKPLHEAFVPAYWIARYPVTVGQFKEFIIENKYIHYDKRCLEYPDNHPVNYISRDIALEYCEWLNTKLIDYAELQLAKGSKEILWIDLAQKNIHVTLPSEAEWEKAARGPSLLPKTKKRNSRIYPWGNEFDPNNANTMETGINNTSSVGCFSLGASPYGIVELSGNVWEWTRSLWGESWDIARFTYPYDPRDGREDLSNRTIRGVLRGTSFSLNYRRARCAFRGRDYPDAGLIYYGFRVVLSTYQSRLDKLVVS